MSDLWKSHTPPAPAPENVPVAAHPSVPRPATGIVTEHAAIGHSIVIKGEVSGDEALFIDGTVEGVIRFPKHRVTVGRGTHVTADIHAQDVVIMGAAKGNIYCGNLLDIRSERSIQGRIVTKRVRIDDGAVLKGSVEIQASAKGVPVPSEPPQAKAAAGDAAKASAPAQAAVPPAVKRAPGSQCVV